MPSKTLYIGKEELDLKQEFLDQPYVREAIRSLGKKVTPAHETLLLKKLKNFVLLSCH
jgi:hypothetical protein